jgi:hypothetical protein
MEIVSSRIALPPARSLKSLRADTSGSVLERTKYMAFSATVKEVLGVIA